MGNSIARDDVFEHYLKISKQELASITRLSASFMNRSEILGSISDKELCLVINTLSSIIEFFRVRGAYFGLVNTHLISELEKYKSFKEARQRNVCGNTDKG